MPNAPKRKSRPWVKVNPKQSRTINMDWFYQDYRWRKFSKAYKQRYPLCVECEKNNVSTPSEVTDHKVRYIDNGPGFDLDNLKEEYFQPLCSSCHNRKSGSESKGFKGGIG